MIEYELEDGHQLLENPYSLLEPARAILLILRDSLKEWRQ